MSVSLPGVCPPQRGQGAALISGDVRKCPFRIMQLIKTTSKLDRSAAVGPIPTTRFELSPIYTARLREGRDTSAWHSPLAVIFSALQQAWR